MIRTRRLKTLGLACLLSAIGGTALADCSDFAAPGVNWRRCLQDGQDLRGVDLSGATIDGGILKQVPKLGRFSELELSGSTITDEQLAQLVDSGGLGWVVRIDVSDTQISDTGLRRLAALARGARDLARCPRGGRRGQGRPQRAAEQSGGLTPRPAHDSVGIRGWR
jgi:hypothetical protein